MTLPLTGIRVLEPGQIYAAPLATKQLAELGAEVIKIESAARIDNIRLLGPPVDNRVLDKPWETTGRFHDANRNKYGIALDFTKAKGKEVFKELVKISDIVVENFTADVMTRLGLDYESLRAIKPDIIMLSATGYGHTGPWRSYRAMGQSLEPAFGLAHLTGYPDEPPMRCGMTDSDWTAARAGTLAILIALEHRRRTGKGQWIDLSQYEVGVSLIGEALMDYAMNGRVPTRIGNRSEYGLAPHGAYRCRGEDNWVTIAVASDDDWARLRRALGGPGWTGDAKFADAVSRYKNQDELDRKIGEWTITLDPWEVTALLQAQGIASGPVLTAKDLLLDPHLKARGFYQLQTMPPEAEGVGTRPYVGMPWQLSKAPTELRMSCPTLGRDNDHIYRELLGLSDEDIEELTADGIISTEPLPGQTRPMPPLDIESQLRDGDIAGYDPNYKEILGLPQ